jgi:hypothetical protein
MYIQPDFLTLAAVVAGIFALTLAPMVIMYFVNPSKLFEMLGGE